MTLNDLEGSFARVSAERTHHRDQHLGIVACREALAAARMGNYGVGAVLVNPQGSVVEQGQNKVFYKGRRCWLPMWPRSNGAYVYLPGGGNGAEDAPSDFFNLVREKLESAGLEAPSWTYKYNGGANPIAFAITLEKANHSIIREILGHAYELA